MTNGSGAGNLTFKNNGQTVMTTTREYDSTNHLKRVASATASGAVVYSAAYTYDAGGRRTQAAALPDRTRWEYGYDALGQVTSGKKRWDDGSFVAGQQFEYAFDTIGNRRWTKAGGDPTGGSLRTALYTNNLLNQITGRQVPGSVDVLGIAALKGAVTVNGQAALRQKEYYAQTLTWNTATGAVCAWVTNLATLRAQVNTNIGTIFLPKNPETNAFDADGNLLRDGRWDNTWDAENRLVKMTSRSDTPADSRLSLEFRYDWQGRRASKVVSNWTGAAWALASNVRFVYDGWNLLAELNATNNGVIRSYAWGTDASGTMQGAGGVGGLLWVTRTSDSSTHFASYDGNHNVMALVNAATGETSAQYEYGTFHELLRATGPMARENVFLAATKYQDWETGFYYYGYRYYTPSTGRWLSRDPIGEDGGLGVYGFDLNAPITLFDTSGLEISMTCAGCGRLVSPGDTSHVCRIPPPPPPPPPPLPPRQLRCPKMCCNGVYQQLVSVWYCERPLGRLPVKVGGLKHGYICCDGDNKGCFGIQKYTKSCMDKCQLEGKSESECKGVCLARKGTAIEEEANATGTCTMKCVTAAEKLAACDKPTMPWDYDIPAGRQCWSWAQNVTTTRCTSRSGGVIGL